MGRESSSYKVAVLTKQLVRRTIKFAAGLRGVELLLEWQASNLALQELSCTWAAHNSNSLFGSRSQAGEQFK
ncbi:hypothetical protein TSUD_145620 [Trifolium subterraneum]|uniref:Uncharacterized protein n=1 Tax=Trifolium subterraneum TaxID=3900 RepID=A0A2Z6MKC0_TRISU|nr:hypothetical protein TSUD_145620 [Trifolium subterraneum]